MLQEFDHGAFYYVSIARKVAELLPVWAVLFVTSVVLP